MLTAEVLARTEGIKREYHELDTVWFMAGSLFQGVSLARRFALVPLGPPLLAYKSTCRAMLTAADGAVELVVDRPYKTGEPIVVWCGPQPTSRLLLNYGYVDEDNPYNRITVQLYVGKEKEAVYDMLPYLRLGYVSDPSEMQSVVSSQGPVCPVSPCMEGAVLDQLSDYFRSRLSGYPTTLTEDETLLGDSSLNPERRVATQLVRLEKKILHACLQTTADLITQLPDQSVSPCPAPYALILS
ncbi:hypothetical protein AKJ16_DCAP23312 [Drosera capensis]